MIDDATLAKAREAKVYLKDGLRVEEPYGQYFKEHVRVALVEQFGRERVYEGGLKVYTTIDLNMQKAAEAAVAASLKDLDTRRAAALKARKRDAEDDPGRLQAALVAMDPTTGHVRALVGGRSFADSHFNRVTQARRQPGSAFKPFVYAAALEAGYTPASLITELDQPVNLPDGAWTPDDEHTTGGEITMRSALRTSSNKAAVRMIEEIGIPSAVSYAKKLGMGDVPGVPSLALGSGEVTLLDLTAAYGTFAAGGMLNTPVLIRRVEDAEGKVIFSAEPHAEQAVTPQTAFLMASMLADVINSGTAWKARQLGFKLPAGGKTGTTNDYHDAWFVGFTPSLVSGVWVGLDTPAPILPGNAYAADVAVPLWAGFMKSATAGAKAEWIPTPAQHRLGERLPAVGQAARLGLRLRAGDAAGWLHHRAIDDLQRVLRARDGAHRHVPSARGTVAARQDGRLVPRRAVGRAQRRRRRGARRQRAERVVEEQRGGRGRNEGRARGAEEEARLLVPRLRTRRQGRGQEEGGRGKEEGSAAALTRGCRRARPSRRPSAAARSAAAAAAAWSGVRDSARAD